MSSESGEVSKPSLLIVEDDEAIQFALEQLFVDDGYTVLVAADLATARMHLAAGTVDAMVLDMRLNHGELGGDLVVDIAGDEHAPAVVILSASPELAVPLARDYGLTWVPKPFDFEVLVKTVRIAFDLRLRPLRRSECLAEVIDLEAARVRRRA